jgi:hypothetical protein
VLFIHRFSASLTALVGHCAIVKDTVEADSQVRATAMT